jgi:hypothetical protein
MEGKEMMDLEAACTDRPENRMRNLFRKDRNEHGNDPPPEAGETTQEPGMWSSAAGPWVLLFGILAPAAAIYSSAALNFEGIWHLLLRQPVETLVESTLVLSLPLANYFTWKAICKKDSRHPIRTGLINGTATGTSLIAAGISLAALALGYPMLDSANIAHPLFFAAIASISLLAGGTSIFLADKMRRAKETRGARIRTIIYSVLGALLSLAAVAGSEAMNTYIRFAEQMATADSGAGRLPWLTSLRNLNPEKDLRMEIADPRSAGLAGLFIKFDDATAKQLYFTVTGMPYKHSETADLAMQSDDYLHRHVVGSPVSGLSLTRSQLSGTLSADSLSSTFDWTFVFKNKTFGQQEARAEIALPPGSVASGLTLWIDGEPRKAAFGATDRVQAAYKWIVVNHRDPALVTDLGRGRVLLQCYPVPAQGELKVKLRITAPLKLEDATTAAVNLPRFVDSNFAISGDNSIRLRSNRALETNLENVRSIKGVNGDNIIAGSMKESSLSNSSLAVRVTRPSVFGAIAAIDPLSKDKSYMIETVKEVPARIPNHLVVVLDGSVSINKHKNEIINALSTVPSSVSASLVFASDAQSSQVDSLPLAEALKKLAEPTLRLSGGQDNLQALIKGAEEAGDVNNGAVLWIHGPQPGFNQEMYIMTPFASKPAFYDLDIDNGSTNMNDFLKNHREIGPFQPVARTSTVEKDLKHMLAKWQPGGKDYDISFSRAKSIPAGTTLAKEQAGELSSLWALGETNKLISQNKTADAAEVAVRYGLVTPVTGATVLESKSDYQKFGLTEQGSPRAKMQEEVRTAAQQYNSAGDAFSSTDSQQAPMLQGAVNGTITPQAGDATIVQGINTAGSVRVNNLANLEALINIIANGLELVLVLWGAATAVSGVLGRSTLTLIPGCRTRVGPKVQIVVGLLIACIGLSLPGCLNWLLASARDANCFS